MCIEQVVVMSAPTRRWAYEVELRTVDHMSECRCLCCIGVGSVIPTPHDPGMNINAVNIGKLTDKRRTRRARSAYLKRKGEASRVERGKADAYPGIRSEGRGRRRGPKGVPNRRSDPWFSTLRIIYRWMKNGIRVKVRNIIRQRLKMGINRHRRYAANLMRRRGHNRGEPFDTDTEGWLAHAFPDASVTAAFREEVGICAECVTGRMDIAAVDKSGGGIAGASVQGCNAIRANTQGAGTEKEATQAASASDRLLREIIVALSMRTADTGSEPKKEVIVREQ
ncbi:hypothetical protein DFH07DRAFT_763614 [Mycena maculata]|uniref:Uncharacterized protein n=1 Tax=Mycena maculata TaxID=230809 RepID=A0AAD7KHR0_9AGAR|nr:hypothetical protein DFH07DRAFT_763614 [Mycena maculata]